jgi:signal transduction histidine kinase
VTKDLREHSNRLRDMIENERLQLARDLHDIIGQRLAALNFYHSWLRSKIGDKVEGIDPAMDEIANILNDTIGSVVEISHGLRPDVLDELGLSSAVELQAAEFERTFGIECKTSSSPERFEPGKDLSLAAYRIIQEALTNISRHSKATRASVGINVRDRSLRVLITDNGIGIDPSKLESLKSLGLIGMRERAGSLGGKVRFSNLKGGGTRVLALFPLNEANK